jgi:hypothetical protein
MLAVTFGAYAGLKQMKDISHTLFLCVLKFGNLHRSPANLEVCLVEGQALEPRSQLASS